MTPLTMTALTEAWRKIDHITLAHIHADGSRTEYTGFPSTIQRLVDGYVSITITCGVTEVATVMYRLLPDQTEVLEPVR